MFLLACGDADRAVIEDPDRLFALRYNHWMRDHGVGLALLPEATKWVREMAGPAHRIDLTFRGGQEITLDGTSSVRVLHVPGHSNGHLAFYYVPSKAVFVGDALHGSYCPSVSGQPSLPPAYFSILAYLSSIQLIESLEVDWIYSAHWPPYPMQKAKEFLDECRRFVQVAAGQVRKALERHPEGLTLRACMDECGPALGNWPASNRWLLMYPLHGHLAYLEETGEAVRSRPGRACCVEAEFSLRAVMNMPRRFDGNKALVTGSGTGIGRGIALEDWTAWSTILVSVLQTLPQDHAAPV